MTFVEGSETLAHSQGAGSKLGQATKESFLGCQSLENGQSSES